MSKKQLHSVPSTPAKGKRPVDTYPKPKFEGTHGENATPEVSRALRRVIQDHSYTRPRESRADHTPSKMTMFLWMLVIGGIVLVGAILNRPRDVPVSNVKTYQLQPRG